MQFDILTIFPQAICPYLEASLLGKACQKGLLKINIHDLRQWAVDKHRKVDDETFGGGEGMVFKPEPLVAAIEQIKSSYKKGQVIYLSPQGRPLNQRVVKELNAYEELLLICGRYEGIDERVIEGWVDQEISLGDFVLAGGEVGALAIVEAVSRLVPGVVGKAESVRQDSFEKGLLEYPHYTRPQEFRGRKVPEVLLSGNHPEIEKWRAAQSEERTQKKRPDLWEKKKF